MSKAITNTLCAIWKVSITAHSLFLTDIFLSNFSLSHPSFGLPALENLKNRYDFLARKQRFYQWSLWDTVTELYVREAFKILNTNFIQFHKRAQKLSIFLGLCHNFKNRGTVDINLDLGPEFGTWIWDWTETGLGLDNYKTF